MKKVLFTLLGIALIGVILRPCYYVAPGFRGVLVTLGRVSENTLRNGFGFKVPFMSNVITFDVQTAKMESRTDTYTKDMQTASINYVFTYNLRPENVNHLYEYVGTNYEAKLIAPNIQAAIKDVVGQWQAQDLVSNRESARISIIHAVTEKLNKEYFENFTFQIIDIDYSDVFEKAIEAKVVAEQDAQKAINNTKRIEEESKQTIIKAQAEAEAMEIKAKALEKNKALVDYEAVLKWDGHLPTYMLGNSTPMINLK